MLRDFNCWLSHFRPSISNYAYYVNFEKVYENVDNLKIELNLMNSLIGSHNIEVDFRLLVNMYPEVLKCIPSLLAVREREIYVTDTDGSFVFDFNNYSNSLDDYVRFMEKTGLFELISKKLVNNLVDYVLGVETGLDSNGRKNRGGHLMEDLVEKFINATGAQYYKEMFLSEIENKWGLNLSSLSNSGNVRKRFDFVVKTPHTVYAIETNFYKGNTGGSKLNETARSYKLLASEAADIEGFNFVWITDGTAWMNARGNLQESFENMPYVFNLKELEEGVLNELFCD